MFDAASAYRHLQALAFPRAVGTSGEEKAQKYLIQSARELGAHPKVQPITLSVLPEVLSRLVPLLYALILVEVAFQFERPSPWALLLLLAILGTGSLLSHWQRWFEKLHDLGPQLESANLVVEQKPQEDVTQRVVFLAHYDSKSQWLPIALRALCFLGLVLVMFGLLFWHLGGLYGGFPAARSLRLILAGTAALCGMGLQLNLTRNRSPGASDNAAAVGILLALIETFRRNPPRHVHLTFLFTGAEEWGMAGAIRYIQQDPPPNPKTWFINLDGIGPEAPIGMVTSYGLIPQRTARQLADDLKCVAQDLSVPLTSVHAAVGIGLDHFPIARRGYEAVMLCTRSLRMALRIHSQRDRVSRVSLQSLERIGKLCEAAIRGWDDRSCVP